MVERQKNLQGAVRLCQIEDIGVFVVRNVAALVLLLFTPKTAAEAWNNRKETDIVHCKDCKHLFFMDCPYKVGECLPDGFCDHGEKQTDNAT